MRHPLRAMAVAAALAGTSLIAAMATAQDQQVTPIPAGMPAPPATAPEATAHPDRWPAGHSQGLVDAKTEAFVTGLMKQMSLREKVGQLIQADISAIKPEELRQYPLGSVLGGGNSVPLSGNDRGPVSDWVQTAQAFRTVSIEKRPGHVPIPVIFGMDSVHGNSNVLGATVFPHNIGLGAAHDPDLLRRIGEATAQESAAAGFDWAFAPTVTVPQDDRWGRSYEGYSERPEIVSQYAAALVTGMQGPNASGTIQQGHVASSIKHFLADGGTHNGIDQGDAQIPEQELIDIHSKGYYSAVNAGAMTAMASFSSWNGAKMHGNKSLLTGVLKDRMGFEGFIVGDWNAQGQVPGCWNGDCPATFLAGLDMVMVPNDWKALFENTLKEVQAGTIPMARVDDAVRRILRVKAKLGLFDPARPFEARPETLSSPEHRAVAREAVAKSLVLLKNNGGLLPVKPGAKVLVTGTHADDIGLQSGGWTLSWQGTGNTNADFPHGTSIWAGLKSAIEAAGGTATLSADGSFTDKPDVAIVVFGERPYAEMVGDISTLEFQPGDKQALAQLKALKAKGVKVVSVFLSGRPLWVNPELNQSDAFVAAFLPGTEGEGVADVLVAGRDGKPQRGFNGKLSFSWPKSAGQFALNYGKPGYDPLFAYGYGLTYADHKEIGQLSEVAGVDASLANTDVYFTPGREVAPWKVSTSGAVTRANVDAGGRQEGGRQFTWNGSGEGTVSAGGATIDLLRQTNAMLTLQIDYRVDQAPAGPVMLGMNGGSFDATSLFAAAPVGQWTTTKIMLTCFKTAGADMAKVSTPFVLSSSSKFQVSIATVRLNADPTGAVCPTAK